METNKLAPYSVSLHEEPGDAFPLRFYRMAEDDDHAVDQAENAYPGCEILLCIRGDPAAVEFYAPEDFGPECAQ